MLPVVAVVAAPAPVRIDDLGGVLTVPVMVNGKGPFHFILDTGAGITVITPQLAEKLSLKGGEGKPISGTGPQAATMQPVTLDRVGVGDANRSNVEAAVLPLPRTITDQGAFGSIDGVLGYTFMKDYAVTFDIAQKKATFSEPGAFQAPGGVAPLDIHFAEGRIPAIDMTFAGARGVFEIDSGNNSIAIVTPDFAKEHGVGADYKHARASQFTGVGGNVTTTQVRVPSVTIGATTLHRVATDISTSKVGVFEQDRLDGSVGHDVLERFTFTIDYPGARAYFQPVANYDAYRPRAGTGLTMDRQANGDMRVTSVLAGGPGALAGFEIGDTVVAVNGRPAASMSLGDYSNAVGTKPGKKVRYEVIAANGARKELTLSTVDLVPR